MRNAGTRRKETHVSPQADREVRAAQGTFRGSQESHGRDSGWGKAWGHALHRVSASKGHSLCSIKRNLIKYLSVNTQL